MNTNNESWESRWEKQGYLTGHEDLRLISKDFICWLEATAEAKGRREGYRMGIGDSHKAMNKEIGRLLHQAGGVADPKMIKYIRLFSSKFKNSKLEAAKLPDVKEGI